MIEQCEIASQKLNKYEYIFLHKFMRKDYYNLNKTIR